ncbi:hypothetical protein C8Q79DRAFT_309152 [Trametes meyenii]|nr:hypothetical protein C8Q79DRAFT_309152 [Trametes meyenii]
MHHRFARPRTAGPLLTWTQLRLVRARFCKRLSHCDVNPIGCWSFPWPQGACTSVLPRARWFFPTARHCDAWTEYVQLRRLGPDPLPGKLVRPMLSCRAQGGARRSPPRQQLGADRGRGGDSASFPRTHSADRSCPFPCPSSANSAVDCAPYLCARTPCSLSSCRAGWPRLLWAACVQRRRLRRQTTQWANTPGLPKFSVPPKC